MYVSAHYLPIPAQKGFKHGPDKSQIQSENEENCRSNVYSPESKALIRSLLRREQTLWHACSLVNYFQ